MTGVRYMTEAKDLSSSVCVQTSSETHPASYPIGTGGRGGEGVTQITHPNLVQRSRTRRSYISSLPWCLHSGSRTVSVYFTHNINKDVEQDEIFQKKTVSRAANILKGLYCLQRHKM
jgi:hypothetical protein